MFMNGLRDKQYKPYKVQIFNKVPFKSAVGCGCNLYPIGGAAQPSDHIRAEKPSDDITIAFISDDMKGLKEMQYKPNKGCTYIFEI